MERQVPFVIRFNMHMSGGGKHCVPDKVCTTPRICTQFELSFVVQEPMACMMNESYFMLVIWLPYIFCLDFFRYEIRNVTH